jgi:hypothetical protein
MIDFFFQCQPNVPGNQPIGSNSNTSQTTRAYHTQHSQSTPSIPALTIGDIKEKEVQEEDITEKGGNTSPTRHASSSAKNSPAITGSGHQQQNESPELQIEYWTSLNYPCSSSSTSSQLHHQQQSQDRDEYGTAVFQSSNVGSKFSMKASVRTLSIAREPMSNLLSILFVKERKKDKVLQKLGRRSKQVAF